LKTHRPLADEWRVIFENTPMKMGILKNHRQKPTKRPKEKHWWRVTLTDLGEEA
jgi:hypothetical protein